MNEIYLVLDRTLYSSDEIVYGAVYIKLLRPIETFKLKLHLCGILIDDKIEAKSSLDEDLGSIKDLPVGFYVIPINIKIPSSLSSSLNYEYVQSLQEKSIIISYNLSVYLLGQEDEILMSFRRNFNIAQFLVQLPDKISRILEQPDETRETFDIEYLSSPNEPTHIRVSLLSLNRFMPINWRQLLNFSSQVDLQSELQINFSVNKPTYELGETIQLRSVVKNSSFFNIDAMNISLYIILSRKGLTTKRLLSTSVLETVPANKDLNYKREFTTKISLPINEMGDLVPCVATQNILIFYRIEAKVLLSLNVAEEYQSYYDLLQKEFCLKPKIFHIPIPCVLPPSRPLSAQINDSPKWLSKCHYLVSNQDPSFTDNDAREYLEKSESSVDLIKCRIYLHDQFAMGQSALAFSQVKNSNNLMNTPVLRFLDSSSL